jgi:hypothetical protein
MSDLTTYSRLAGYTDNLAALRFLMSYPITNWVSQYFTRTRSQEAQLRYVEYCRAIFEQSVDKIEPHKPDPFHFGAARKSEYERFDRTLLGHEFCAYDRLNRWHDYICLFEKTLREKHYIDTFLAYSDDPVFSSYIRRSDWKYKYVHFLYKYDRRYRIICRKQKLLLSGKGVEHLKRHQQDRLSNDELDVRCDEMERLFKYITERYYTRP